MADDTEVEEVAESAIDGEHEQSNDLEQLHAKVAELEARLEQGSKDPARIETFFVGFAVALAPGVALAFMGIEWFRDNLTSVATGVLAGLLIVGLLTVVLFLFRVEIMRALRLRAGVQLREVVAETAAAMRASIPGSGASDEETEAAIERAGQSMASWYSWVSARRAAVWILLGLLSTFALFIGESLIYEQNELIRQQNQYFREQNAKIQEQLAAQAAATKKQEEDTLHVRKNELLRTIYEMEDCDSENLPEGEYRCLPAHPLRLRQEAVIALAGFTGPLDLHGADLRRIRLNEMSLPGADFGAADLNDARMRRTDLTGARLSFTDLSGANLGWSELAGAELGFAKLVKASLLRANLSHADLWQADLTDATVRSANFTGAKLHGTDLSGARGLEAHQLSETCGSSTTKIPSGFARPRHWFEGSVRWGDDVGCPPGEAISE